MKKKLLLLTLAAALSLSFASCAKQGTPADSDEATSSGNESVTDSTPSGTPETELVYGTATLTYAEFYAGDVSSVDAFDAVTSATNSKANMFPNISNDFVDAETNADGYHILGVKNVYVAVSSADAEAFAKVNPTFQPLAADAETPKQYKTVSMENGKAVYSATNFNVVATVTDATASLQTGSVWGDYQINVTDGETKYLRNTRNDADFAINSNIMGIILETKSGLKVGTEFLQNIWVQTYEVSFNVSSDNSHNTHISGQDNLAEFDKLVGETVTKIIYIMPDSTYVYEFEGIYIKPAYTKTVTSVLVDGQKLQLSTSDFSELTNPELLVTYKVGSGRTATTYTLLSAKLANGTSTYALDLTQIPADADRTGVWSATITSDNYSDITVAVPMSAEQKTALEQTVQTAKAALATSTNAKTLQEHINEAEELLADPNASSADVSSLIAELNELISAGQAAESGDQGGHSGRG